MAEARIAGRVLHRGSPQAGCRVIAGDEASGAVVADARTDDRGAFELALPDGAAGVLVVAACDGEALGVVSAPAPDGDAPLELELVSVAPTHAVTVRLAGEALPDWARPQIRLMPLAVGSLDGRVLRWITAPVQGLSHRSLASIVPEGRELRRHLQAGRWWIAAGYFEERAVRAADQPEPRTWTATRAWTADGTPLAPVRNGFELPVDGPAEVTLELTERAT
jgi:hypothetical protein